MYFQISRWFRNVDYMDVVICEPIRTPVGRMGGVLAQLTAAELATTVLAELVRRTGLGEGDVDDVVVGQGYANGESPAMCSCIGLASAAQQLITIRAMVYPPV